MSGQGKRSAAEQTDKMISVIRERERACTVTIICEERDDHAKSCECVTHGGRNLSPSLYKLCKQNKMLLLLSPVSKVNRGKVAQGYPA